MPNTMKFEDAFGNVYDMGVEAPNDPDFDYAPRETLYDVDGNEYEVSYCGGYAELKHNTRVRYALDGDMRNCFTRGSMI